MKSFIKSIVARLLDKFWPPEPGKMVVSPEETPNFFEHYSGLLEGDPQVKMWG